MVNFGAGKHCLLGIDSWVGKHITPENFQVIKRFVLVFEQAYTRFLDLQKAEAQAREAQIEAALEKVRSKAMAIHTSKELSNVVKELKKQIGFLGQEELNTCVIHLYDESPDYVYSWVSQHSQNNEEITEFPGTAPKKGLFIMEESLQAYLSGLKDYTLINEKAKLKQWMGFLKLSHPDAYEMIKKSYFGLNPDEVPVFWTFSDFTGGSLLMVTLAPPSDISKILLRRFSNVFGLAYQRYLDLRKAEEQAREARIEAALERLRSRGMEMQKSDELKNLIVLVSIELKKLDIILDRSYLLIVDTNTLGITWWIAYPEAPLEPKGLFVQYNNHPTFLAHLDAWQQRQIKWQYVLEGKIKKSWDDFIFMKTDFAQLPETAKVNMIGYEKVFFSASFNNFGGLCISTLKPLEDEQFEIILRFAKVFDQTYTRFLDLKKKEEQALNLAVEKQKLEQTLVELRATQAQLIQAEKLASLGELTAGIAHEIQNPLNFVNNFAEVSSELLDDMKADLQAGKTVEAAEIADDLQVNLQKINHHGKRASAIVKGMLEHSRTGDAMNRVSTDLNALADEYLRLAYHGLRAKDSSFNATLETHFDPDLPKIEVIPQDIGRVLLNLINNAFYAVHQRAVETRFIASTPQIEYQPTVTITTQKLENTIEISVKDNGIGIPEAIKDKIFQPFFTTKPTGQGTGLGLSLAYDIVTKGHGGSLEVKTKEKEGTVFTIMLPLKTL